MSTCRLYQRNDITAVAIKSHGLSLHSREELSRLSAEMNERHWRRALLNDELLCHRAAISLASHRQLPTSFTGLPMTLLAYSDVPVTLFAGHTLFPRLVTAW